MRVIKVELPKEQEEIILCPLFDLHIGEPACDIAMVEREIEFIKNTPNAYAIIGGDIMDNATTNSIGDVYTAKLTPQQQLEQIVGYLKPISKKILAMVSGNHEERTWRESGIDLLGCVAMQLGIEDRYAEEGAVLFVCFGNNRNQTNRAKGYIPLNYSVYITHGSGGGRKVGGKANRLYDLGDIVDCDCVICGHTHEPICFKKTFFRTDRTKFTVIEKERLYVNTGSFLNYAKYAERKGFLPNAKVMPKIYLSTIYSTVKGKGIKHIVSQAVM